MAGCLLAALTYFPLFKALTEAANPELAAAQAKTKVVGDADPAECSFQFNPIAREIEFTSSCDIAKQLPGAELGAATTTSTARPARRPRSRSATR